MDFFNCRFAKCAPNPAFCLANHFQDCGIDSRPQRSCAQRIAIFADRGTPRPTARGRRREKGNGLAWKGLQIPQGQCHGAASSERIGDGDRRPPAILKTARAERAASGHIGLAANRPANRIFPQSARNENFDIFMMSRATNLRLRFIDGNWRLTRSAATAEESQWMDSAAENAAGDSGFSVRQGREIESPPRCRFALMGTACPSPKR